MIKTNKGTTKIEGTYTTIMADFCCICHSLVDNLVKHNKCTREEAVEEVKKSVEIGCQTKEEVHAMANKMVAEMLLDIANKLKQEEEEEQVNE